MLRTQLKSKIHLARISDANIDYEGSISIPEDLMQMVDLWPGELVLVASRDSGARLETYAFPGPAGSGAIVMNGAAMTAMPYLLAAFSSAPVASGALSGS